MLVLLAAHYTVCKYIAGVSPADGGGGRRPLHRRRRRRQAVRERERGGRGSPCTSVPGFVFVHLNHVRTMLQDLFTGGNVMVMTTID